MKSLADFVKAFFQNKGQYVFVSLLVAKICAFVGSLFIIRFLPENDFGMLSVVAAVFAIFSPFSGFGSMQSLLRFGSISNSEKDKKALSAYLFRKGFLYQIFLSLIFFAISVFYIPKYEHIVWIFLFFGIRLFGFYFFGHVQSELRINGKNRDFGRVNNVVNISNLVLMLVLAFYFGIIGYLIANAVSPFISLFWYKKEVFFSQENRHGFQSKEIWNYAFHASGTALLSDTLFSADVLMLSFLLNEAAVAHYKVAILIPANITFLALTFLQSDFTVLAKNALNKNYLIHYISNYYKIFIPICLIIFSVGYFFRLEILHLFFSEKYSENTLPFVILLGAFCMNMLFRNLYGNLLSAVGLMKMNTLVSVLALFILLSLSIILVPHFGMNGMAISMASTLIFTGFFMMFSFIFYLRKLK